MHVGRRTGVRRALRAARMAMALALLMLPLTLAAAPSALVASSRAPTAAEVLDNTRPLIRARLRLPDSLHRFAVVAVQPGTDDPARYAVEVQFRATSPFGAVTEHHARFRMKRSADNAYWVVTAE